MKKLLTSLGMMVVTACGGVQNPEGFLKEGMEAPQFSVADHNGKSVSLMELHEEGPLILTFLRSFY